MADFSNTIKRLRRKSLRSRIIFLSIGTIMLSMIGMAFYLVVVSFSVSSSQPFFYERPADKFDRLIYQLLNEKDYASVRKKEDIPEITKFYDKEIELLITQYDKYLKVLKPSLELDDGYFLSANSISKGLISLGTVVFGLLLIQIFIMFMKYFARLAELYEAQADALEASSGDPELAHNFMEKFSPILIEIEKTPETIYEKALTAITSATQSKSKP